MLHAGVAVLLALGLFISVMGGAALFRGYNKIAGSMMIVIGVVLGVIGVAVLQGGA